MRVLEISAFILFSSMALFAAGWHMASHTPSLGTTALERILVLGELDSIGRQLFYGAHCLGRSRRRMPNDPQSRFLAELNRTCPQCALLWMDSCREGEEGGFP
jgi:hypothetical protein